MWLCGWPARMTIIPEAFQRNKPDFSIVDIERSLYSSFMRQEKRMLSSYLCHAAGGRALARCPRPGKQPQITVEQRCQMAALGSLAPSKTERPISQWTGAKLPTK
jgi:hypothetical protein